VYSPDGARIASASWDRTVKVWDAASGAEVFTLRGHTGVVLAVAYSPDGSRIASGSVDTRVKVWDAITGAEVLTLRGHAWGVGSIVYSPDGSRIATGSRDSTIRIWDTRTGQALDSNGPAGSDDYDPWGEDLARRTVHAPLWHAEDLQAARLRRDTFATEFHRRRLLEGDNYRLLGWAHLAAGDLKACQEALRELYDQQRASAALARPWLAATTAVVALGARPTPTLASSPPAAMALLRQEELRLAALLVHAAAVPPTPGIDARELVKLAQHCVEADPENHHYRALLGAALYRADKPEAAIQELTESVRLSGQDGSLWARLFLALAHQRLGHREAAEAWEKKADKAGSWEEEVMQAQLLYELAQARRPPKQ
jgi:tetratricopeptide (TPR) repeat protein